MESGFQWSRTCSCQNFESIFQSFLPCYGLAETTVFSAGYSSQVGSIFKTIEKRILEQEHRAVTSEDSINSLTLISVGKAWDNEKILIVDPQLQTICKPCQVGEIWIQGQHVAQGYWNQSHGSAAFSIMQDGKEAVVIVAEIRREKMRLLNKEELFSVICQAIS